MGMLIVLFELGLEESEMKATGIRIRMFVIIAGAPGASIAGLLTACGVFEHDNSCISECKCVAWNLLRNVWP